MITMKMTSLYILDASRAESWKAQNHETEFPERESSDNERPNAIAHLKNYTMELHPTN